MKVLVYGVGVIGSLTVHELCAAGNDVTVIARGQWKKVLEKKGLRLKSHSGKKRWVDHPRVLSEYDGGTYDVTFSIMQNQQQDAVLDTLASVRTNYLVLVGNNMESREIYWAIHGKSNDQKTILFGFQTSGGLRHKTYTEVLTFHRTDLTLGHLKGELTDSEKDFFRKLFSGSSIRLTWEDDMESWYRCHAAFIVPAACLSYSYHCDLRKSTRKDTDDYIRAGAEAYAFLESIGTQIRPKGDDKNLHGIRRAILTEAMRIVFKTSLGEDWVTGHCRNAVAEMQFMDEKFEELRTQNPSFSMPTYDRLRENRPDWEDLRREYAG